MTKQCAERPCPTCPWRKSSTVGGADIPGFDLQKMRNLANTVAPRGERSDAMRPIMACHHSAPGSEYACAGYVMQEGETNINVRLLAAFGKADIEKVRANCEGIELYSSFFEMLDDYEAASGQRKGTE